MEIAELLKAFLMNQAAHTGGHMQNAYDAGMDPAYVNWKKGVEVVPSWVSSPQNDQQKRTATQWQGSGFTGQQELGNEESMKEMASEYALAQGLYKLGYLSKLTLPTGTQGDVENMERISGNKMTPALLGLSALSDLYKAYNPESRLSADFITPQGAPGIKFNWKF